MKNNILFNELQIYYGEWIRYTFFIEFQLNTPKPHSPLPTIWKASYTTGFTICEFWYLMILVASHLFCTIFYLQLSFYRPLCYNSRSHCPLVTTTAILAVAHSYFVVSLFKCEGKNSCHDLILIRPMSRTKIRTVVLTCYNNTSSRRKFLCVVYL